MDSTEIRTLRKSKQHKLLKDHRKKVCFSPVVVSPIIKSQSQSIYRNWKKILQFGRFKCSQQMLKINAVPQKLIFFSIVSPWEPWWHNQAVAQETTMARYLDTHWWDHEANMMALMILMLIFVVVLSSTYENFNCNFWKKWTSPFHKITNFSKYPK